MYVRKPLNYELFDLRPFIDSETMNEHYNVHYKKYTENMNQAIMDDNIQVDGSIQSLVAQLPNYENYSAAFRNNAGGYINHMLYFDNISPYNNDYEAFASDELKEMIDAKFGGYENFKESFKKAGKDVFGSGWVWLASDGDRLMLLTTANQDNPLMAMNVKLLLGMDVWEHAYYLKHKADRASYIDDFLRVVDWQVVSNRL